MDKTAFVHGIACKYQYVLLCRRRRFGKSLTSSAFHRRFEGREELFDGLAAWKAKRLVKVDVSIPSKTRAVEKWVSACTD